VAPMDGCEDSLDALDKFTVREGRGGVSVNASRSCATVCACSFNLNRMVGRKEWMEKSTVGQWCVWT
jgi:hypothetical protein